MAISTAFSPRRIPVNSYEVQFMRQRIEGEPVSTLRDTAINALRTYQAALKAEEKR